MRCRWVKADGQQCGVKTEYTMVRGDDGVLRRVYKTWCAEHEVKVRQQADTADEELLDE